MSRGKLVSVQKLEREKNTHPNNYKRVFDIFFTIFFFHRNLVKGGYRMSILNNICSFLSRNYGENEGNCVCVCVFVTYNLYFSLES